MANRRLLACGLALAVASGVASASNNIVDRNSVTSALQESPTSLTPSNKSLGLYIVQLRDIPAVNYAQDIGELVPDSKLTVQTGNQYNPNTSAMRAYVSALQARQVALASTLDDVEILHQYTHTFNGFSARLTSAQVQSLRKDPRVLSVYEDQLHQVQTSNTPEFLGLTGEGGQHTMGIKGEDVIVGILDTGIWPENPSFIADDSVPEWSYGPAPDRWQGECNVGSIGEFVDAGGNIVYNDETVVKDEVLCNNKLIGARYFGSSFSSVYEIQFGLGEYASARDADGHGSHTAGTAAGNAAVPAMLQGVAAGTLSGIAPRARVATYKVCWNGSYVSPEGVNERGCFFGDSMAAIDQAVADGVDVLNYSIGNSNDLNTPVYIAALRAADAGVFFAASAGNSGPGAGTVGNIAPWVATVAASTYDGVSVVIGSALEVDTGDEPAEVFSIPAGIGTEIPAMGLGGELMLASPQLACDPLANDLTGKIALIERGACAFTTKMSNAEAAGAIGVVVFTDDRPIIAMGAGAGDTTVINIPGVMVNRADGLNMVELLDELSVNVTLTDNPTPGERVEEGNIMASFSSRGANPQSANIIKPDFTAPGVRILAAVSPDQIDTPLNSDGEDFAYLQGTSMSSPHIAGMAALLSGQYPAWTPAQIKSALMTTARQNVVKEDGETPADPFDFGAGHAAPVAAMNPGIVYSSGTLDYLGFLCGESLESLVTSLSGLACSDLAGFTPFAASQLNYPSIAVSDLAETTTVSRTVTDVTGSETDYLINVDAPAGVDVTVMVDGEPGNLLTVPADGEASYELMLTRNDDAVDGAWVFGSVTLDGNNGIEARSPIAVSTDSPIEINVPEFLALDLNRGRANFAVQMLYSGRTSMSYVGLTPPFDFGGVALDNSDGFDFIAGLDNAYFFNVFPGTKVLRFQLTEDMISPAVGEDGAVDIDLRVYRCTGGSCVLVGISEAIGTDEDVLLRDPEPRFNGAVGDLYIVFPVGFDTQGFSEIDLSLAAYFVDGAERSTRISMSSRAIDGRWNNVRMSTRGLSSERMHMGAITFFNGEGEDQGTTVLEVQP